MSDVKKYLKEYFSDWDLTEEEKSSLDVTVEGIDAQLAGFYSLMKKMIEDSGYREEVIVSIDKAITGNEDDNKKDA
jgi:hypothetical protein